MNLVALRASCARRSLACLIAAGSLLGPALFQQLAFAQAGADEASLVAPREFRAVWVATVANIDWPSRPGLPSAQQQQELIAIFDRCAQLNLNAVILQVRPSADALYDSPLEPWSEYLSGEMGVPPSPPYDPLAFAVEEAHARGLELHAWFNPYRVRHADAESPASPDHASIAAPELVRTYGPYLWFDPGESAAVAHFLAVVEDVIERYDVDGVHIDDYFYPYPIDDDEGKHVPFPDESSYARALAAGETLSRDDWRRQNVDRLVEQMYDRVKRARPNVKVGISPFGIWQPGYPEGIAGFNQYASLYADARKWLREGWVDYFTPQLYWKIDAQGQSYPKLLAWWADENVKDRQLWPGNFTSRVRRDADVPESNESWRAAEIIRQIQLTRAQEGATGNVHFSMKALMGDRDGLAEKLRTRVYAEPALVPACDWLPGEPPAKPIVRLQVEKGRPRLEMALPRGAQAWQWAIRTVRGDDASFDVVPGRQTHYELPETAAGDEPVTELVVTAVSRSGRESPLVRLPVRNR